MADIKINGATPTGIYVGSTPASAVYYGNVKVWEAGLPALATRSMRFDFKYDHFNPLTDLADKSAYGFIWTHLTGDVYDFHYDNADWGVRTIEGSTGGLFNVYMYKVSGNWYYPMANHQYDLLDMDLTGVTTASYLFASARQVQNIYSIRNTSSVADFSFFIGSNNREFSITSIPLFDTSSATNMSSMFKGCTHLTSAPLFNTENVTNSYSMFYRCTSLTSVPFYDLTSVTNTSYMFYGCTAVKTGAYELYYSLSTKPIAVTTHNNTFTNCGSETAIGQIGLSQIPTDWGGTMA